MKRKTRRGGMIRKRLTTATEEYRVLSIDIHTNGLHVWGTYKNLEDAVAEAHRVKTDDLEVYVHGASNRVISKV